MVATLAGEPWLLSREKIGKLDRWYIKNVLFHPRNRDGSVRARPRDEARPYDPAREQFHILHVLWNVPRHEAARIVRERMAAEGRDRAPPRPPVQAPRVKAVP